MGQIIFKITTLVSIFSLILSGCGLDEPFMPQYEKKVVVEFKNGKEKLFLWSFTKGMLGNTETTTISTKPLHSFSELDKTYYVFNTKDVFYKSNEDTLFIYVDEFSVNLPESFNSDIVISIIDLPNASTIRDYCKNYSKYGLKWMGGN